jgi:NAD(P)-dependent dehydrogenase (short-subunit alcohol dehydrogenase family)
MSAVASRDPARMSLLGFAGRVALVSGAARGIGLGVTQTFLALGARVAACDLDAPEIEGALGIAADVTDDDSVQQAVATAEAELGPISLLVTCAGVYTPRPLQELDLGTWRQALDVNLTGTFLCVRRVLPSMAAQRYGRVVTLSSMAGVDGGDSACAHYAASKGGVIAFTKSVSKEYCTKGITANVVAPRNIRTRMLAGMEEELTAQTPVGRLGEVDDVAAAVAFLSSAHAGYITGEVMNINGGWW